MLTLSLVRPAWAHSCRCKSRRKLITANEVKRNCTEAQRVTSGGLAQSPGGTGGSEPISESEVANGAVLVVGRSRGT